MSNVESLKEDFGKLKEEWLELDPNIRFIDLIIILNIAIFGIGYIIVNVLSISLTVTNAALMIFPVIMSGYLYVLRSKLVDEAKNNQEARKEFLWLVGLTLGLIFLTIIYSFFLNTVT